MSKEIGQQPEKHSAAQTAPATEKPRSSSSNSTASRQDTAKAEATANAGKAKSSRLPSFDEEHPFFFLFLQEYPLLRAFRHGVMLIMPLLLAAAIALLINNFPVQAYQNFMLATFGDGWKDFGSLLYNGTIEILALVTSFSLSVNMMYMHNEQHPAETVLPSIGAITSFSCLLIMMGPTVGPDGLLLAWAGIRGLFGSLIITLCACSFFLMLCRVRAFRVPFYSESSDPILHSMFDTLVPVLGTLIFFVVLREGLSLAGIDSLHQTFYDAIRAPFHDAQDSFGLGALYAFLVQFCWFFGIHGADLLDPITHHVLVRGMEANSWAINHHLPPPHIFTKYFFDVYLYMGGSGSTLGLLLAIFLRSKDNGTRRIAGISILPGLFNINEMLLFGLPVVLNPAFLLPFLFVPLVLLLVSYLAVMLGLAPLPVYQVDWTTPPIINAFLSTNSWRGVAMQIFNLILATLIYLPFVVLADKAKIASRKKSFADLVSIAKSNTRGITGKRCTDRSGSAGALARSLANDMLRSLDRSDGGIVLHYQPRVDLVNKTVPCVEALLRWEHPIYGSIPAPLTLAIAEDGNLSRRLDNRVLHMAFEQQQGWRNDDMFTTVAINLSEEQLRDPNFPALLRELYEIHNLPLDSILLEVRESLALDPEARYLPAIQAIRDVGAFIAVDDFGKGYQVISHVKRLPITELQIDRALVREVSHNKSSQDVIGTIQELCFQLGIKTTAEHVEHIDQLETLLELNFSTFQGFYFSKPVPADECRDFLRKFGKEENEDTL